MNGYLVIAACNFDDIPIRMYATEEEALAAAQTLDQPEENPLCSWDVTGFICAKVLRFVDGVPQGPAAVIDPLQPDAVA